MRKGGRVKKPLETIKKLALRRDFESDVKEIRKHAGIPLKGYANRGHEERNIANYHNPSHTLADTFDLLKKYQLPPTYFRELQEYVKYGNLKTFDEYDDQTATIFYPDNAASSTGDEASFKKLAHSYVGIYIHDASSKEEVTRFVRKNWRAIRESIRAQGGIVSRTRTSTKNETYRRVIELLQLSTKDLRRITKNSYPTVTKNQLVAEAARIEGLDDVTARVVQRTKEKIIRTPITREIKGVSSRKRK